jgi:hypothetical protein
MTFPQELRISKHFGHPTMGSGGTQTFKRYLKSEHTDRQTDGQTHRRTNRRTFQLIESIGPEGRCFENHTQFPISTTQDLVARGLPCATGVSRPTKWIC